MGEFFVKHAVLASQHHMHAGEQRKIRKYLPWWMDTTVVIQFYRTADDQFVTVRTEYHHGCVCRGTTNKYFHYREG